MPFKKVLRSIFPWLSKSEGGNCWHRFRLILRWSSKLQSATGSSLWSCVQIRACCVWNGAKKSKIPLTLGDFDIHLHGESNCQTSVDSSDSQVACLTTRPTWYQKYLRVDGISGLAVRKTTVNCKFASVRAQSSRFWKVSVWILDFQNGRSVPCCFGCWMRPF